MSTSTINTPAELWLRHVLDTEIEPLYRKLPHSKAADQTQAFCSEVQVPKIYSIPRIVVALLLVGFLLWLFLL